MAGKLIGIQRATKFINRFFTSSVSVEPFNGYNVNGEAQFGATIIYDKARVEQRLRIVRAKDGTEQVSRSTVYISGIQPIDPEDRLIMPDGSHPPIIDVMYIPDNQGLFTEIILQ